MHIDLKGAMRYADYMYQLSRFLKTPFEIVHKERQDLKLLAKAWYICNNISYEN